MHGAVGGGHGGGTSIGGHHHGGVTGTHHHHDTGVSGPYLTPRSGRRGSPGATIAVLIVFAAIIGAVAMVTAR